MPTLATLTHTPQVGGLSPCVAESLCFTQMTRPGGGAVIAFAVCLSSGIVLGLVITTIWDAIANRRSRQRKEGQ